MKLAEAKMQFISSWGAFATHWGINRTMAQVHALLLVSANPLTQDDVMQQLNISRGNVNMNIRELIDWGLVERVTIPGSRKELFVAEKDIWKVTTIIARERKKRELDPMMKLMEQISKVEDNADDPEVKRFVETVGNIRKLGKEAEDMINLLIKADENWFLGTFMKLLR
ncbi:MAG: GbsR/MarR family transcriptional regulator [Chitinophagaceae bacterium]